MSRDIRKNDKYFEDYIIYQNKRIEKFRMVVDKLPAGEVDKKNRCFRTIANFQKDLFSAKYSIGASKTELKRIFDEYISILTEIKTDEYAEYIDALAIGILLDSNLNKIKDVAADEQLKDGLVTAILNPNDLKNKPLNFASYYQIFFDYILGRKDSTDLSNYISKIWYGTNTEFAWYDSDKSSEDIYTGYWCWIAGACLKLKHDSVDPKVPYIPLDLL